MKVNIRDLMDNIEDSSVNLEEDVVSTARIKEMTMKKVNNNSDNKTNTTKHTSGKTAVIAAIAVALVAGLGITSYAEFGGGLENLTFGTEQTSEAPVKPAPAPGASDTPDTPVTFPGDYSGKSNNTADISLQGYSDSPEYLASKEWNEFEMNYDTDWAILNEVGNDPTEWDEKYGAYTVYSQEMADKIDEITAKYDLKLHSSRCTSAQQAEIEEKFGVLMSDATYVGYYFEDGTLQVDGSYGDFDFQLRRTVKGVLDTVYLGINGIDDYEQWTYTTASGVTVYLALSEGQGLMIADCGDSFVVVNAMLSWSDSTMSKEQFEAWADKVNFADL